MADENEINDEKREEVKGVEVALCDGFLTLASMDAVRVGQSEQEDTFNQRRAFSILESTTNGEFIHPVQNVGYRVSNICYINTTSEGRTFKGSLELNWKQYLAFGRPRAITLKGLVKPTTTYKGQKILWANERK